MSEEASGWDLVHGRALRDVSGELLLAGLSPKNGKVSEALLKVCLKGISLTAIFDHANNMMSHDVDRPSNMGL